jgi:copper(I)-binding protein
MYVVGGVLLALIAVACADGGDGIEIEDPWGRTAPSSAANATFSMTINRGDTDDTFVSAEADVCGAVEFHETVSE